MHLVPFPRLARPLRGDCIALDSLDPLVTVDATLDIPAEGYRLRIDDDGAAITAADAAGAFYGRQTLGQLVQREGDGWSAARVEIEDAPRFAYRGVMLDVARHFFAVDVVKAYIERASALKFNHLHLHLSDDQGWRLELRSRPELVRRASDTAIGSDPGGFYTQEDYRAIIDHAAAHHMTVVPEFDMPSHTHAVGLAYRELAEDPVLSADVEAAVAEFGGGTPRAGEPYTGFAVGFSSLRIDDEATYAFVRDVMGELAELTPGPYIHFGGDEAHGTDPDDYARFVARASAIVAETGKTPIAWHEAGVAEGLAPGTIGQYWGYVRPEDGADAKARGFVSRGGRLILSPADAVYLDMKPDSGSALGLTWANGPTSLEDAYSWEPLEVVRGVEEKDVLGVEAPMWAETLRTLDDIDAMAFPRIAAAAEVAWSPRASTQHPERTWTSFRTRVEALRPLWRAAGIRLRDDD